MMSPERAALNRDDTYNYVSPLRGSTSPLFQPRAHARGYFLPALRASNSSFATETTYESGEAVSIQSAAHV